MNNVFWVRLSKQDIQEALKAANLDVLFEYPDDPDLYALDDRTGFDMVGSVIQSSGCMIVWFSPSYPFQSRDENSVEDLGNNLSKRFLTPAIFGNIIFDDNNEEPFFDPQKSFHNIKLDRPRTPIDFNETCGDDLYFLSQKDTVQDTDGKDVHLKQGLHVFLYDDDYDDNWNYDPLLADAIVEKNDLGTHPYVKWLAKIIPNDSDDFVYRLCDTKKEGTKMDKKLKLDCYHGDGELKELYPDGFENFFLDKITLNSDYHHPFAKLTFMCIYDTIKHILNNILIGLI